MNLIQSTIKESKQFKINKKWQISYKSCKTKYKS